MVGTISSKIAPGDCIGKTLYAAKNVNYYEFPTDGLKPLGVIPNGEPIGVIHSFQLPKPGRAQMYWQVVSDRSRFGFIYVKHVVENFSFTAMLEQGVKTVAQKTQEAAIKEAKEQAPVEYYADKYGSIILITIAALVLGTAVIKKKL